MEAINSKVVQLEKQLEQKEAQVSTISAEHEATDRGKPQGGRMPTSV